ncbi:MAG: ATP-binding protein [Cyanobacteria bacterium P01_D01_bin.73]
MARPLTDLLYPTTQGNPFFTTQFLQALYKDQQITFNGELGYWECDLVAVKEVLLGEDVVDFMASRLKKLPAATQNILKLAACIGNQFDLQTVAIASESTLETIAVDLWPALQEGLIFPLTDAYKFFQDEEQTPESLDGVAVGYRFPHDRIQQAAYSLLTESKKAETHLTIGRQLWRNLPEGALGEKLFSVIGHLNISEGLITEPDERRSLVELNLQGCKKAKRETAYGAAQNYANQAINLLGSDAWQTDYALAIAIHNIAAEVSYLFTDFETAQRLSQIIINNAQQLTDAITSYELLVQIYIAQDKQLEAIETGLSTLRQLGIPLFDRPDWQDHLPQLPSFQDLANAPAMTDPGDLAALRILITITPPTHHVKPELFPTVVLTMVDLCERKGISASMAYAYGIYGLLLDALVGDPEMGHRSGQLSLEILDKFSNSAYRTKVNMLFAVFVCAAKDPGRQTLPLLEQGIEAGLEIGDIEYVSYCIMAYVSHQLLLGIPLEEISAFQAKYEPVLIYLKQEHCIEYAQIWFQGVDALTDINANSEPVSDKFVSGKIEHFQTSHNQQCLFALHLRQLMLCYGRGDYAKGHSHALKAVASQDAAFGILLTAAHNFYYSLTLLGLCQQSSDPDLQSKYLRQVDANQGRMRQLATHSPENYQHKFDLVEAERYGFKDEKLEAIEYYDRAIAGAKESNYPQEEALANELAAQFYLGWGKSKIAVTYLKEAYYGYSFWGAGTKAADLEDRYPELLRPILQSSSTGEILTALTTISPSASYSHCGTSKRSSSGSSLNQALDLGSVLEASQALSRSIQLDELLQQLTRIILRSSGGDHCVLALPSNQGQWQVRASATPHKVKLCHMPLEESRKLPVRLVQYVKNTQETVVINQVQTKLPVISDYLQTKKPQSVLCLPVLNQGNLIGIFYLENQTAAGVFTGDRIVVLNFLCTQAAISLENARLYRQVQQTLTDLQEAQLQIVQNEKMSVLGSLVSGIAHEINNPIGCILGNVAGVKTYMDDLLELLDRYAAAFPNPGPEIEEDLEEIDLDYVRGDLPDLIRAMKNSGDRITAISRSLRTFSRADTAVKQAFNIHEGIDSTLLILRHRLKGNELRPAIDVVQNYGSLPDLRCFPGQLNQVFMNILANAIDALDEESQGYSVKDMDASPRRITIQTSMENNQVKILIGDNGPGIKEDVQSKIFDHLFTTKSVGKGTGLGLAIARRIITEVHGGTLAMESNVGEGTTFHIRLPVE